MHVPEHSGWGSWGLQDWPAPFEATHVPDDGSQYELRTHGASPWGTQGPPIAIPAVQTPLTHEAVATQSVSCPHGCPTAPSGWHSLAGEQVRGAPFELQLVVTGAGGGRLQGEPLLGGAWTWQKSWIPSPWLTPAHCIDEPAGGATQSVATVQGSPGCFVPTKSCPQGSAYGSSLSLHCFAAVSMKAMQAAAAAGLKVDPWTDASIVSAWSSRATRQPPGA
jgi:hypothetical protein